MTPARDDIRALQRLLAALGQRVAADGLWGPETRAGLYGALSAAVRLAEIDPRAVALVKDFEGFRSEAYRDPVGIWTIGYGTTAAAGVGIEPGPGMVISEAEAEGYLRRALRKFAVEIGAKITAPTTPAEFGAFLSLAYNIGPASFARSAALRHFNAGDKRAAADAILLWNKAGGRVLPGLTRRREAERALFLS